MNEKPSLSKAEKEKAVREYRKRIMEKHRAKIAGKIQAILDRAHHIQNAPEYLRKQKKAVYDLYMQGVREPTEIAARLNTSARTISAQLYQLRKLKVLVPAKVVHTWEEKNDRGIPMKQRLQELYVLHKNDYESIKKILESEYNTQLSVGAIKTRLRKKFK